MEPFNRPPFSVVTCNVFNMCTFILHFRIFEFTMLTLPCEIESGRWSGFFGSEGVVFKNKIGKEKPWYHPKVISVNKYFDPKPEECLLCRHWKKRAIPSSVRAKNAAGEVRTCLGRVTSLRNLQPATRLPLRR